MLSRVHSLKKMRIFVLVAKQFVKQNISQTLKSNQKNKRNRQYEKPSKLFSSKLMSAATPGRCRLHRRFQIQNLN